MFCYVLKVRRDREATGGRPEQAVEAVSTTQSTSMPGKESSKDVGQSNIGSAGFDF